jgi:hypothetical protein
MALVPLIIRWGAETSSDQLGQCARCTQCGHKGATLPHAGWNGTDMGFLPFPVEKLAAHYLSTHLATKRATSSALCWEAAPDRSETGSP